MLLVKYIIHSSWIYHQYLPSNAILSTKAHTIVSFYKALEELEIYCLEYKLTPSTVMKYIYDIYNDEPNKLKQSNVIRF